METEELLDRLRQAIGRSGDDPIYRRLVSGVEGAIADGGLKRGGLLPSERVLAEALSISRVTVRKAIDVLVTDGLLRRHQGARTEVVSRVEKSLSTLSSFSEDMKSRGLVPGCLWLSREVARPLPAETMALGLAPTMRVARFRRVRTADETPIATETASIPERFLPDPSIVGDSLYEALATLGALPQRAVQRMHAGPASQADAELLGIEPGASLLIVERRCFLADEQIVEFTQTRYRGDVYDFVLELAR